MKISFLSFIVFLYMLPATLYGTDNRATIKYLTRPFLDSLKIVIDKNQFAQGKLVFESITPVTKDTPEAFSNSLTRASFIESIPVNGRRRGLVSPPLDIFNGGRIAFVYSFSDANWKDYELSPEFTFKSYIDGEVLKQTLTVSLSGNHPVSRVLYSMFDVEIWEDNHSIRQAENDPPVLRRVLSLNQEQPGEYKLTYYYKDYTGAVKGTYFQDGADISEPQFIGGDIQQKRYFQNNIRYPEDAREKQVGGNILVNVTIDENGNVKDASIMGRGIAALNQEALRVVRTTDGMWIPAQRNGVNKEGQSVVVVQFQPDSYQSEEFKEMIELLKESRNPTPPETKGVPWDNPFIIILIIVAIIYIIYWWRKRSFIQKCQQPNDYPYSIFNRELMKYNEELPNDGFIIVTGASAEEVREVLIEEIIDSIEEIAPGMVMVKTNRRLEMGEFYYLVYIFNEPLTDTWKGKAVGWITVPFMDTYPKGIPSMVYTEYYKKGNGVYITMQDNSCWLFDPVTYRYEGRPLKKEYRNPPSPLKGGLIS